MAIIKEKKGSYEKMKKWVALFVVAVVVFFALRKDSEPPKPAEKGINVFSAASGSVVKASIEKSVQCYTCRGTGICGFCDGKGGVTLISNYMKCRVCQGSGLCEACDGNGYMTEYEYILEYNKDNTPIGIVKAGAGSDIYACAGCFGTGICPQCNGDAVSDATGRACTWCESKGNGICRVCGGKGYQTRDEHNQWLQK